MTHQPPTSRDTPQPNAACPICGKPADASAPTYPFCTPRCRQIDLGRWLDGRYVISRPIEQADLDEE